MLRLRNGNAVFEKRPVKCLDCKRPGLWVWILFGSLVLCRHERDCPDGSVYFETARRTTGSR